MDSDRQDFEKSLPGMGIPRWMKKSEKFEYVDFCQSPPSHDDGFFHFGGQPKTAHPTFTIGGQTGKSDCVFRKVNPDTGAVHSGIPSADSFTKAKDCKAPETTSFFKTVSSSSLVNLASSQAAQLVCPKQILAANQSDARELPGTGKLSDSSHKSTSMDAQLNIYTSDSALTVLESTNRLARRNENPFFTGSTQPQAAAGKSTGSWLFRSSNSSAESEKNRGFGNIMYETRNDNQMDSSWKGAPTDNKSKTRYIPKPSQLRELNFWSPTSM